MILPGFDCPILFFGIIIILMKWIREKLERM
jgi:hypothetical protein